jgi:pimeloyl-ACP methyl ester carboxylesterase
MEAQARGLKCLLDHLGVEDLLIGGHDFGGPVALTLLRLYPALRLRGLILTATNLFTDTFVPPPLRLARVPALGPAFFALAAGNRAGLGMMYRAATVQRQRLPWRRFRRHLTPGGMRFTWRIFQRSLADLETNYRPVQEMLPRIGVPTLVLWGDRDPFFSTTVAERSHRAIPGSVLDILPATGHFVPEEQPELVAASISRWHRTMGRNAPTAT